jgi:nucleoside-diphosphate-sugar epimerase
MSTLQNALREAVGGGPMNWIGGARIAREYAYVKDATRAVVELAHRNEAYGQRFVFPGGGPLTGERLAAIAGGHLGRDVKLRAASPFLLRMVALFDAELRSFLPMVPHYVKPLSLDTGRLEALLGPQKVTPYAEGVARTLDWISSAS